jgi:GTP-binding protein
MTNPPGTHPSRRPLRHLRPPDATTAMGWMHTAKFLTTAPKLQFLPR